MTPHVKRTLEIAEGEVGVREIGTSNTGRKVQQYQAATTLGGTGWPWCAAFVVWCERKAADDLRVHPILIPSASCDAHLDYARRNNILSGSPLSGDLFLVMASQNNATHIGYVLRVDGERFITVEGNTNTGGSRNGNGVYTNRRILSARYKFIRWGNLTKATEEPPQWAVRIGNNVLIATIEDGAAWVAAHQWAKALGLPIGWNSASQAVTLQDRDVPSQAKLVADENGENRAWLPVRVLADFSGLKLKVEPGKIEVTR